MPEVDVWQHEWPNEEIGSNDPTYSTKNLSKPERDALNETWRLARERDPRGAEAIGGVAFRAGWFGHKAFLEKASEDG